MNDEEYAPIKQVYLLLLSLTLFLIYLNDVFKNDEYNKLCLAYSIFIILWLCTISFRYALQPKKNNHKFLQLPTGLKCLFNENNCQNADFTFFTIIHIVSYIIIGYYVPDQYVIILIVSVLCEFMEYFMGFQAKFILDPIVNIVGYFIGSQLNKYI
jgi:hypothetical protein